MDKSNAATVAARRPWHRLHLSTWLTLPLGIVVVAVFVVLPGESGKYPKPPSRCEDYLTAPPYHDWLPGLWGSWADDNAVIHGWPLPFLWRTPRGWTGDPAKATRGLSWRVMDSVRAFRIFPLLVDLLVVGIGLILFAAVVEWRRRKRARALQFSLRELLTFAALVAVALGWLNHQRAVDREVMVRLGRIGRFDNATVYEFQSRLPLWLRSLAGDESLSWLGINRPTEPLVLRWDSARLRDIQYVVERFPRETLLTVTGALSSEDASAIAAIDRLEQMEYSYPAPEKFAVLPTALEHHPRLRSLTIKLGVGSMDAALMKQLGTLPRLESLSIVGRANELTDDELAELRNCQKLTKLELPGVKLSQAAMDCLGGMKQLQKLNLRGAQFVKADVSPLSRLQNLRELAVDETNFDDDDARQLRALPNLRFLDITHTQATAAGINEMLDPSSNSALCNLDQLSLNVDVIDDELIAKLSHFPQLRRITVTDVDGGMNWNGTPKTPAAPPLIPRLQKALPNCDVDLVPYFFSVNDLDY